jgi:hypothetical protein
VLGRRTERTHALTSTTVRPAFVRTVARPEPHATVKELIDRITAEAEQIIRRRLTGFLDGTVATTKPARAAA